MATQHAGVAEIVADGAPRAFQYTLTVTDEKLRLWIEDTVTKKQWQSKDLELADFVTPNSTLPMAKAKDYAARVAECLTPTTDNENPTRSLTRPSATGARVLTVGVTIQIHAMNFAMALEYSFPLDAVKLDPMDLLSTRVRELESITTTMTNENAELKSTVKTLTAKLEELTSKPSSGLICAQFSVVVDKVRTDRLMKWKPVAGFPLNGVSLQDKDAALVVAVDGVYSITIDVRRGLQLLVNGLSTSASSSQSALIIVGAGDLLTIEKDDASGNITSRISVVLMRELDADAVKAAKAAAEQAAGGNNFDDDEEPIFDAYATTDDY